MASRTVSFVVRICLSILLVLVVILGLERLGHYAYEFGYRVFTEKSADSAPGTDVVVVIRDDMGKRDVARLLEEKGLTNSQWLFLIQYRLTDQKQILPGTYVLNSSMTTHDIARILAGEKEDEETDAE